MTNLHKILEEEREKYKREVLPGSFSANDDREQKYADVLHDIFVKRNLDWLTTHDHRLLSALLKIIKRRNEEKYKPQGSSNPEDRDWYERELKKSAARDSLTDLAEIIKSALDK